MSDNELNVVFKKSGFSGFHKGLFKQFMGARGVLTLTITSNRLIISPPAWLPGTKLLDLNLDIPLSRIKKVMKKRFLLFNWIDIYYYETSERVFTIFAYWPFTKLKDLLEAFGKTSVELINN